ncbi:MAG: hypothetical protein A3C90_01560, partial [Candidatus Magasanikbacteria bacterium RIFCSPHIGHO2_02_FULL_51_14]
KLRIGSEVEMPAYLKVSDTGMQLFGFQSNDERIFFQLLITVSGVGPKTAMHILSLGSLDNIQSAISRSDVAYLTAVQGIGKKTAERVVVELKSKVTSHKTHTTSQGDGTTLGEAIDGLVALGYSKDEARDAVHGIATDGKSTETILREALKHTQ